MISKTKIFYIEGVAQNKTIVEEIKSDSDQLNGVLIIMFIISGIIMVIMALYIMIRNWNSNSDPQYTCKQ